MAFDLSMKYLIESRLGWGGEKAGVCVGGFLRMGEGSEGERMSGKGFRVKDSSSGKKGVEWGRGTDIWPPRKVDCLLDKIVAQKHFT